MAKRKITLTENIEKISDADAAIREAIARKRELIEQSKIIAYDTLSALYELDGQKLVDKISDEHQFIDYLTKDGLSLDDIAEIIDNYKSDNGKSDSDAHLNGQMAIEY